MNFESFQSEKPSALGILMSFSNVSLPSLLSSSLWWAFSRADSPILKTSSFSHEDGKQTPI